MEHTRDSVVERKIEELDDDITGMMAAEIARSVSDDLVRVKGRALLDYEDGSVTLRFTCPAIGGTWKVVVTTEEEPSY